MTMTQAELKKFVEMWPRHTVNEIAVEFDITPRDATVVASNLRANGVELRDQRRRPVDYEALAQVAREASK